VSLKSMNGDLTLWLPGSAGADVEAATMSGHIRSEFGAVPAPSLPAMHAATFRVGAGGTPVKLQTSRGDVSLKRS
jgi:hypothetical protein